MDEYLNRQRAPLMPDTPPGLNGWNSDWYQAESDRSGRESWGMRSTSRWICIQCAAAKYHWESDRGFAMSADAMSLRLRSQRTPMAIPKNVSRAAVLPTMGS